MVALTAIARAVRECFLDRPGIEALPAGEGDYCRAVRVGGTWIFLFPKHAHASACLDRLALLTPDLAADAPLALPLVEFHGRADGLSYVGYRAIAGQPVSGLPFPPAPGVERKNLVSRLAGFFRHVHGFDLDRARSSGVPQNEYAFGMREDGLLAGRADDLYRQDLETFRGCGAGDRESLRFLSAMLDRHLESLQEGFGRLVLLHNEVSGDHVLVDAAGRVSGVIDFNGMLIGRPARDFLYLYEEFGRAFARELIEAYGMLDPNSALEELHFLHVWHTVLRLLWAVRHAHGPGVSRRRGELDALRGGPLAR